MPKTSFRDKILINLIILFLSFNISASSFLFNDNLGFNNKFLYSSANWGFESINSLYPFYTKFSNYWGNYLYPSYYIGFKSSYPSFERNYGYLSYEQYLSSIEIPYEEAEMPQGSYIFFNEKHLDEAPIDKDYEYYIPATILSEGKTNEGYVPSKEIRGYESTKDVSPKASKEIKDDLNLGENIVVKKVIKPFNFYYSKDTEKRRVLKEGMYLVKKNEELPYIAKASDGNFYSYNDVYYCNSMEEVRNFTSGNDASCKFGRAATKLLNDKDYASRMDQEEDVCLKDSSPFSQDFLEKLLKTYDSNGSDFDSLLNTFKKTYREPTYSRYKKNLKNEEKVKLGAPHQGISVEDMIREVLKASKEFNLDPKILLALIYQESRFKPSAESGKDAIGLMQIRSKSPTNTGAEIAGKLGITDYKTEMLYDPKISIRFGAEYLSRMIRLCDGNIEEALISYNRGYSRFIREKKEGKYVDWYSKGVLSQFLAFNDKLSGS